MKQDVQVLYYLHGDSCGGAAHDAAGFDTKTEVTMRSIIEEIAQSEDRAEQIRAEAAVTARERVAAARENAARTLAKEETEEAEKTRLALEKAEAAGEAMAKEMLAKMECEADELCARASERVGGTVQYLVEKARELA